MTSEAESALKLLIKETRAQADSVSWAATMLQESGVAPEDAHFFVETLNAAAAAFGREVLSNAEHPSCSFCLKTSKDVLNMVTSPNANICNECSEIVTRTLATKRGEGKLLAWLRRGW